MTGSTDLQHIVWITETASAIGGCEAYIAETARALRSRGLRSTLLYNPEQPSTIDYLNGFDAAFPMVSPTEQINQLTPDIVYIHRLQGIDKTHQIAAASARTVRFFHDHRLFCLREHKYTALTHRTCTRRLGAHCLACPGWLGRRKGFPYLKINRLSSLRRELDANRRFDHFVVGSSYMADHLGDHDFPDSRIHQLPLYAPSPSVPESTTEPELLLFVGQLVRGKGVDTLLRALALMESPVRLAIVGSGPQQDDLQRLARDLGVHSQVAFEGYLTGQQKSQFYAQAAVVVMPSRAPETFGLVGLEAMSFSTPVVASDVGGIGQWLHHGKNGVKISPNDPAALAAALQLLVTHPTQARVMGAAGRRLFEQQFTEDRHIDGLIDLFSSIAGQEVPDHQSPQPHTPSPQLIGQSL